MAICLIGDDVFVIDPNTCTANIVSYGHLGYQRYNFPSTNFSLYVLKKESGCTWIAPGTAILYYESSPGTWVESSRISTDSGQGYVSVYWQFINPGDRKWKMVWDECTKEFTSGNPAVTVINIFNVDILTRDKNTTLPIPSQGVSINGVLYTSDTDGKVITSYEYKETTGVYQTYTATNDELMNGVYMKITNNTGSNSSYGSISVYHQAGGIPESLTSWDHRPPWNQSIWINGETRFVKLVGWVEPYPGSPTSNYTITSITITTDVGSSFSWSVIYAKKLDIALSDPSKLCTAGCGNYTLLNNITNITLDICTPNWQCEQPLNGYENDSCGSRRLNAACNPPCIPNWQCRQPLDGYETDLNSCGEPDRLNAACNPPCTPNWQCEQPLNGYENDGCGNRRLNSVCNPSCTPNWQCEQPLNGYENDGCGNRRLNTACNPLCTPNWQCRQPLDSYETDTNNCGEPDRIRVDGTCNPSCTPNWQCRQPLDGYETDTNNCGEPDRIRVDGTCNPSCTPNWQCEQPLNGYENDGCGNRRLNTACNPPCTPNWQCRQPLDSYETDTNNCGEPDRIRVDGTCNAVVQEGIGGLGMVIIAGIAIGAIVSMSSGTFIPTRKI